MAKYRFDKCIVRIHGNEPENLKAATEIFMKKVIRCKKEKSIGRDSNIKHTIPS